MSTPARLLQASETCLAEDLPGQPCGQPTVSRSLCAKHARRFNRNGDTALRRAPNGEKTSCIHKDGCPRPRQSAEGWCHMHHMRVIKHGDPGPAEPLTTKAQQEPCTRCREQVGTRKGLCPGCYRVVREELSPAELREMGMKARECDEADCGRTVVARGKCSRHYRLLDRVSA